MREAGLIRKAYVMIDGSRHGLSEGCGKPSLWGIQRRVVWGFEGGSEAVSRPPSCFIICIETAHLVACLMCFLSVPADKESMSTDLMKVPMRIIEWEECLQMFPSLTTNMLCASYGNESYDACQVMRGSSPYVFPLQEYLLCPPRNRLRF